MSFFSVIKNSWKFFKKNWYKLTLYQLVSALGLSLFLWYITSAVREKMDIVTELNPQLQEALSALGTQEVLDVDTEVLNSLNDATSQIILLTIVLIIGGFVIYSILEGLVWKNVLGVGKKYLLGFSGVTALFTVFLLLLLYFPSKNYVVSGVLAFVLISWMHASYVKLSKERLLEALVPGFKNVLKSGVILFLGLGFIALALTIGGIVLGSYTWAAVLAVVAIEICLFLKVVLSHWIGRLPGS
tara:strand:- start:248 stop:976 length:729 start_codon:yes stop_codon:yes gene_type:complete